MATKTAFKTLLYDQPAEMEPLLPESDGPRLAAPGLSLIRGAERLGASLHPATRLQVAGLLQSMNSYYSNLLEGHRTKPRDIDAALRKDFSSNPVQRSLQIQHLAHMQVQREMETRLQTMEAGEICSTDFLCWLHEGFYRRLPAEFRFVKDAGGKTHEINPGKLREGEVSVGLHMAPASKSLKRFLDRFREFYGPLVTTTPDSLVAAACAHHRLTWIHPFLDGNGRVARLFTHAWFVKSGIDSAGLWTLSRGLARRKSDYQAALANADERRLNDYDGRGYLSQRRLVALCEFILDTATDQVEFMREILAVETVLNRITGYAQRRESSKELLAGSGLVLNELFLRGEVARGEVGRIVGVSPRSAQKITATLLTQRLVTSSSPKGPLRLGFPAEAVEYYFPNLYPPGAD